MKKKLINIFLLAASLLGYLEWGNNKNIFLFQAEAEIIQKAIHQPLSVLHPLTILPFLGQLLILYSIFQKIPGRILTLTGFACLATIMLMLLIIGVITANIKILGSTIPFIIAGILIIRTYRKPIKAPLNR